MPLPSGGKISTEVSEIMEDDMINAFGVTKDHMLKAAEILGKEEKTVNLGNSSAWLVKNYRPRNYGKKVEQDNKEVLCIQTGSTKGTTFKINVDNLVLSSLFDTGAQVSCIKYDTVAALGLLSKISDNNINVRTANGQDMGIKGLVMVNFKIGPSSFTHKFVVCEGLTRPFILGTEFLSHHCFILGWTDDNKRFTKYRNKIIAVASQAVMDDRIMVSHPCKNSSKKLCHGSY